MVQERILSFLAVERQRFCRGDLCRLARNVLSGDGGLDFWVEKAARNLFDVLSEFNYEWISGLSLDSGEEERVEDEFDSVPGWLEEKADAGNFLPWLPMSREDLTSLRIPCGDSGKNRDTMDQVEEDQEEEFTDEVVSDIQTEIDHSVNDTLGPEMLDKVGSLNAQIMNFESVSKTVDLASKIQELCCDKGRVSSVVLELIQPWLADDETASVLISHLSTESGEDFTWQSQVLSSIMLPKLLALEEPAPRVLLSATIEYCKLHQKAAEYGLLLPLILRKDGINSPICDVITKIIKECLHTAQVSAFCQKLLCGGKDERRVICLPSHRCLLSDELDQEMEEFS